MLKKIELKYGKTKYPVHVPEKVRSLKIQEPEFLVDQKKFTKDFSRSLPKDLTHCHTISIVVADKTRLCGYKTYLPWVLDILHKQGARNQQIQFFIAYGTHAKQSDEECLNAYGEPFMKYKFIHHDCSDKDLFTHLGKTKNGTRIHVRKDILESDLIITFGALSHHYFAGYGGGRKLLFPGLGYTSDIFQNHGLFLDKHRTTLTPGCRPGNFENNPLAQDLKDIDDVMNTQKVCIHGILGSNGNVCQLVVGKTYNDFLKACKMLDSFYKMENEKQYSLILASCGGFPKDINFIQAHKAINNAAMFVKENGVLIVLAECIDGIGSDTFIEYFNMHNFNQAFDILKNNYKGNGGTALSMMTKAGRIKIFLKTALDDKVCKKIGVERIDEAGLMQKIKEFQYDMACIENASVLIYG
ncbi:MAG: nickel-dependent lactate racemase [Desulfobacteraceae bacterium]|nr:nickel-dependent lactate racemase [Desulfobacteraceae bacterium]